MLQEYLPWRICIKRVAWIVRIARIAHWLPAVILDSVQATPLLNTPGR
jgi:hypothetical protein